MRTLPTSKTTALIVGVELVTELRLELERFSFIMAKSYRKPALKIQHYIFLLILVFIQPALAADPTEGTGMKLPRFASLKSDNAYIRTGPSMDYPIKWIYKRANLPVEIVQEFDAWRKIKDPQGETGWVHKLLLSGKRTAIITSKAAVMGYHEADGKQAAFQLEPGVIATVSECGASACLLETGPYEGWVQKNMMWGVYPDEIFN